MATERQIESNQKNAARSTGPRTEAGKARSRANATKHGLAGESAEVEAMASSEFLERRVKWAAEQQPVGEASEWALDRAVAASLRIERCERAIDEIQSRSGERAGLAWDQDRAVEAATVFNRLGRDPVLASRQLQTTYAGVSLLIDAWLGLASTLQGGGEWSEAEVSKTLDLLGVPIDCRSVRTLIDDPEGGDVVAYRRALTLDEIERLEALRDDALAPLEEMEQRWAMAGDIALLSKPARLVLRYERDAWKRYRESMSQVRGEAKAEAAVVEAPAPRVEVPPIRRAESRGAVEAGSGSSFEEERRALQAMAAPIRELLAGRGDVEGSRVRGRGGPIENSRAGSVTERTRFAGGPLGEALSSLLHEQERVS